MGNLEKDFFETIYILIDSISNVINNIRKNLYEDADLPNVAITYNNKLVELGQIFKKSGISFYNESLLREPIRKNLLETLLSAVKELQEYGIMLCAEVNNEKEMEQLINNSEVFAIEYRRLDNKIWKFDIKKEIVKVIMDDMKDYVNKTGKIDLYSDEDGNIVLLYIEELKKLGMEEVIPELKERVNEEIKDYNKQIEYYEFEI